jgi:sugar phosphate permease
MIVLGSLMHKVTLKNYVLLGLLISSLSFALWPVLYGLTGFYSTALMIACQCVNGLFQATGWPGMVGMFSRFFKENKKGVLMGIWSMNSNIGNLIA